MGGVSMMFLDFQKYSLSEEIDKLQSLKLSNSGLKNEIIVFLELWDSDCNTFSIMSSGTTGKAKRIAFKREALVKSAKITLKAFDLREGDSVLHALPIDFIAGKMMLVRAIVGKLKILIVKPSSNPIKNLLRRIKFAAFTPFQVQKIINESEDSFINISIVLIGGSKVEHQLEKKLASYKTNFYETFGMSETLTHIAIRKLNGKDKSPYFNVLESFSWAVDKNSCLRISAQHLANSPLLTNDLVEKIDAHHFLWIGRIDNVINSGGIKISPEAIEKKLDNCIKVPFIISKLKDKELGEKVVLYIEEKNRKGIENSPIDFSALGSYEKPREIKFINTFPRNENGKIERKKLNG
jgi:O-succinylbenzoic acid--CoA ligase